MTKTYNIVIVGATGVVGSTLLSILEERKFPIKNIVMLASKRSAGDTLEFLGKPYLIEDLAGFDFSNTQIAFFCAGGDVAEEYAPVAAAAGAVVIDKSSHFRYDPEVPLIVPEVNLAALKNYKNKNIIASPNCNTIPLMVALKPIYDTVGILRMNVATYQSVSGTGKEAVTELIEQTAQLLNGHSIKPTVYPQQIAFNVLPHIDSFLENGYTKEEMKVVWESQKILDDANLAVNATTVRVPVVYGHSAAVNIETREKIKAKQAEKLLSHASGVKLVTGKYPYPTPIKDAAGVNDVFVGRVREDLSHAHGLNLWIVADNLRKGAALNSVQIAEKLIELYI